jgi:glycosyltransferase involved in cell wall biosynthesis
MERTELISVIIPTYNRAYILRDAIRSVLAQRYPRIELIVVDDGSTDNTSQLMKGFWGIKYIVQPHSGQAAARNTGLSAARGSLIATLDSDDSWEPDFLMKCSQKLREDQLDFVFANWYQDNRQNGWMDFMQPNPFIQPMVHRSVNGWITLEGQELRTLYLKTCPSPSSSALIRRSSIRKGWNTDIHIGDDWGLYLDIILHGHCRVAFTLEKLWRKRVEEKAVFEGLDKERLLRVLYIEDFSRFLKQYHSVLSPSERLILEKKYMESLVELAKNKVVHKYKIMESFRLMKQSMDKNLLFTVKTATRIFASGLISRVGSIL